MSHQSTASLVSVDLPMYHESLEHVLTWMLKAEEMLQQQGDISQDVRLVKQQFHDHEVRVTANLEGNAWTKLQSIDIRVSV